MPKAPPFSTLFLLSEPVSNETAVRGSVEHGAVLGLDATGEPESPPVRVLHAGGSGYADFVWTDEGLVCVSDRLVRTLSVNAVTGWETFPVDLLTKAGRPREDYSGLRITGRCGPLDYSESERIDKITPEGRERAALGLYFERDSWDGSMMFSPPGSSVIVVTERVRSAFAHAGIGNIWLRSLDSVEVSGDEYDRWSRESGPGLP